MSCGSSMLAMIFSSPPQRVQLSISTPNTRFSRLAQLIATCRGVVTLVRVSLRCRRRRRTPAPLRRRHLRPILTVRRKHAVIPRQVHPRLRHQRREARHQIQRLQHNVRGAIPIRRLERVAHLARCRQRQALAGHRRPAHIAAQSFQLLTLIRRNVHTGGSRPMVSGALDERCLSRSSACSSDP